MGFRTKIPVLSSCALFLKISSVCQVETDTFWGSINDLIARTSCLRGNHPLTLIFPCLSWAVWLGTGERKITLGESGFSGFSIIRGWLSGVLTHRFGPIAEKGILQEVVPWAGERCSWLSHLYCLTLSSTMGGLSCFPDTQRGTLSRSISMRLWCPKGHHFTFGIWMMNLGTEGI